jgi:hypothetical protein
MSRNLAFARAALALTGVFLASTAIPASAAEGPCPPERPVVSAPAVVNRFETYAISWTNVLGSRPTGPADIFVVERSEDETFAQGVERFQTNRTSNSYGAPLGVPRRLYHRVSVQSFCSGPTAIRVPSNVVAVDITDQCNPPIQVDPPAISPAAPPAYTTYVVSWDTLTAGTPGPGGGAQGLRFRLRRTTSFGDVNETFIDTGTAAFVDGPGEYTYELRTENVCGEASEWSRPARVVVGTSKTSALVLVSAPKPFLVPVSQASPRRAWSSECRQQATGVTCRARTGP